MNYAVVTGAAGGIGSAIAQKLSHCGYGLVLLGRDQKRMGDLADRLETPSHVITCDLQDPHSIASAVEHIEQMDLPVQALIHNAGVYRKASFTETPDEEWERQFQISVQGPIRLTRGLLARLTRQPVSYIVSVSSTLGVRPVAGASAYSAMKAAMNNWTQGLALELADRGVRVNAIATGIVDTPIHEFHNLPDSSDVRQQVHKMQPIGRMGTPADVAHLVGFLCSEASTWTTGSVITLDGGISLV